MTDKPKIIHSTKLFGGRETAEDVFRRTVLRGKSCACGAPAVVRAFTFVPADEFQRRWGIEALKELARRAGESGKVPMVKIVHRAGDNVGEDFIRLGVSYACEACVPTMEKELARGPSWVGHYIDRGPGKDRPVFQVM